MYFSVEILFISEKHFYWKKNVKMNFLCKCHNLCHSTEELNKILQ